MVVELAWTLDRVLDAIGADCAGREDWDIRWDCWMLDTNLDWVLDAIGGFVLLLWWIISTLGGKTTSLGIWTYVFLWRGYGMRLVFTFWTNWSSIVVVVLFLYCENNDCIYLIAAIWFVEFGEGIEASSILN